MRRVLVTGASSGIGKAIYEHYKSVGDSVWGISRRGPDLMLDLCDVHYLAHSMLSLPDAWNHKIDVAILNAGIMPLSETVSQCQSIYNLNFRFNLEFFRSVSRWMDEGGCVIVNASVSGVVGDVGVPYYSSMKAAIINLVRSYAKILAPLGIRVNCFSPGFFLTNLVPGEAPVELLDKVLLGKREADPKELISIVDGLVCCQYITGQNIIVDGGLSL